MSKTPVNAPRNDCTETHPNAPIRLIRAIKRAGSARKFSVLRGVNISYISRLVQKGIEPTDRTDKGQDARAKLFLPRTKRRPRVVKPEEFVGQKKIKKSIRKMVIETKKSLHSK